MGEDDSDLLKVALRGLPSVEVLASSVVSRVGVAQVWALRAARETLEAFRARLLSEDASMDSVDIESLVSLCEARAVQLARPGLRQVLNATGVVLHTNLGRAPLAPSAIAAVADAATAYSNLEFDLAGGVRGSRGAHVDGLLCGLCGTEAALAVNNNAAAVLLALAAGCQGGEVLVSRGQLIEIGGSFRIPEILAQSGARLVEVGTTNRTRISDFELAIGESTRAILHVHRSNFSMTGFVEEVPVDSLVDLAAEYGIELICDLGSGALDPIAAEPTVGDWVRAGAGVVCFSADKLFGGPQAGVVVGRADFVSDCRRHPLARALRLDKLQLAALEATCRLHLEGRPDEIPAVAMLTQSRQELKARAVELAGRIGEFASVSEAAGQAGGGTLPGVEFPGAVCLVDPVPWGCDELVGRLRRAEPPVIARIEGGKVVLDPRTLLGEDLSLVAEAVREALAESDEGS